MHTNAPVTRLFEEQVAKAPDQVVLLHGDVQWTYRSLNARANQFARYLQRYGVSHETRVLVCGERCPDLIAVLLGVAKAGAAYVPLEPMFPAARIAEIIATARAPLLVTLERHSQLEVFPGEMIVVPEHEELITREDRSNLDVDVHP